MDQALVLLSEVNYKTALSNFKWRLITLIISLSTAMLKHNYFTALMGFNFHICIIAF